MEQKRTKEKKKEFLENHIRCGRYISRTCRKVGISRDTYYRWNKSDWIFNVEITELEERRAYKKEMFAEAWAKMMGSSITAICDVVGISRWTYYNWRSSDLVFVWMMNKECEKEMFWRFGKDRFSKSYKT